MHTTKQWEYLSGWDGKEGIEEHCQTLLFDLDSRAFWVAHHMALVGGILLVKVHHFCEWQNFIWKSVIFSLLFGIRSHFLVWSLKKKSGKASLCSADWLKRSKVTFIGLQTWKRKKHKNNYQEKTKAENNYVRSEGEELQLADKKKMGKIQKIKRAAVVEPCLNHFMSLF